MLAIVSFLLLLGLSASDGSRYAYSVEDASILSVIDTTNPSVVDRIGLGSFSSGVLVAHPAGKIVYVGLTNSIAVVDANSRSVVATIPVANTSQLVVNSNGGTLYALTIT